MNKIPSYTKIITLGSSRTENALKGDVIIQEKVDGSQFKWGVNERGELLFASKGTKLIPVIEEDNILNIKKLFIPAVKYLLSIKDDIISMGKDVYFYGETLCKPKHNVLKYDRTPKNNIVLFDALCNGGWMPRKGLEKVANNLGIDLIPELYKGQVTVDKIKELLNTPSYLGNEKVEGVVIKNYNQSIILGGFIFPLFTKYVRESFKERHNVEWKIKKPKDCIQSYINGFKNENRWRKAILHLKERGMIEQSPKDIGKLIMEVKRDIKEEEEENIKNYLYKIFINRILRTSTRGLPEWYKNELLNNINNE